MKAGISSGFRRFLSTQAKSRPQICIVGGGPAGFYAAQHLSKHLAEANVDIIERLPVPFGLVRFGVAPDHPEVKNVINTFTKTAQNPRVNFYGNVNLGTDVTLQQLKQAYHVVLLSYGADKDRKLNIPGEDLPNVISARSIVGWYNGTPWDANLPIDLSGPSVAIFGQGNVAIDVARILLTPVDILKTTDITNHALDALSRSKVKTVYLIGRRGPLQAAFTIKELREMLKLPDCTTYWNKDDFVGVAEAVSSLPRPKKRITELMLGSLNETKTDKDRRFVVKFFRSPLEIIGTDRVNGVKLGINRLEGDDVASQRAILTDKTETLDCDLVVRSIGYQSVVADRDIPFDENKGIVVNKGGKIMDSFYAAGWVGTGPTGVILTTMGSAFATADSIIQELSKTSIAPKGGFEAIGETLQNKNVQLVTWEDWEKIDKYEQEEGKKLGKPREKIIDFKKMLEVAAQ